MGKKKNINKFTRILKYISGYWPALGLCFTIMGVLAGWVFYDVKPFQPFEEIAAKKKEYI